MKKVELHLHFDGSLSIPYASKLMGRDVTGELVSVRAKSLAEYLDKFTLPARLLQSREDIEMFASLLAKDLESDEVIYAEVRFCPLLHTGVLTADEVIEATLAGFRRVPEVKINLILCMMRNFSIEENKEIIRLAKKYQNQRVVAIDLAGDEASYPTSVFEPLFELAKKESIPYTIHAGEADGADSVHSAIKLGAKRIGHGVRSIESSDVIQELIQNKVTLEVCPKSNLDTGTYQSILEHPVRKLVDAGVLVTINTDNRTVSNTSLEYEYDLLRNAFGFTDVDFLKFNINAINSSFLSDEEKEELKKQLL